MEAMAGRKTKAGLEGGRTGAWLLSGKRDPVSYSQTTAMVLLCNRLLGTHMQLQKVIERIYP